MTATEPRSTLADHPAIARLRDHGHWLAPAGLVLLAGILFLVRLDEPARIIFDETYYVEDAKSFLRTGGVEESFAVHPPVGKWLIAASIQLLGDSALGWRASGAVVGAGTVLVTWLLAMRLFGRRWQAAVATFLLALDGLFLVQARTAMLDIHLAFFVAVGAWLLVRDLHDLDRHAVDEPDRIVRRWPRDRWLAGVAFGLACATKWSGLLAIGAAVILVVAFELLARRRAHGTTARGLGRLGWLVVGPLVLAPAATYVTTYVPWLVAYEHTTEGEDDCREAREQRQACTYPVPTRLRGLWREHVDIARFHRDLESTHAYRSQPHTWPLMLRPVAYYYETCPAVPTGDESVECEVPAGTSAEVLALGNPGLWWSWALLVPLLTGAMGRRDPASWVVAGFHSALFVPWLVVARPAFFFYMVPAVPFLALGMAAILGRLRTRPTDGVPWVGAVAAALVGAVGVRVAGGGAEAAWIGFGVGWVLGPLLATSADEWWRQRLQDPPVVAAVRPTWHPTTAPPGTTRIPVIVVGGIVLAAAATAFAWFAPLWYGVPIESDALRARWWFDSWI